MLTLVLCISSFIGGFTLHGLITSKLEEELAKVKAELAKVKSELAKLKVKI